MLFRSPTNYSHPIVIDEFLHATPTVSFVLKVLTALAVGRGIKLHRSYLPVSINAEADRQRRSLCLELQGGQP